MSAQGGPRREVISSVGTKSQTSQKRKTEREVHLGYNYQINKCQDRGGGSDGNGAKCQAS